jgi:hypothetical protein
MTRVAGPGYFAGARQRPPLNENPKRPGPVVGPAQFNLRHLE